MRTTVPLRMLVLLSSFPFGLASRDQFVTGCSLNSVPLQEITRDPQSGEFVLVKGDDNNDNNDEGGEGRRTESLVSNLQDYDESSLFSLRRRRTEGISDSVFVNKNMHRSLQTENGETEVYLARECSCASRLRPNDPTSFCLEQFDACGIPQKDEIPVGCFGMSSKTVLIRNAWPVVILWYAAMVLFLLFTEQGRHTRYFIVSKCCNPNVNRDLLERYWLTEGGYWRLRQRRGIFGVFSGFRQRRSRQQEAPTTTTTARSPNSVPPLPQSARPYLNRRRRNEQNAVVDHHAPNQLTLKTKRYDATRVPRHEDADDAACAICFSPLEDGDRVGALMCDHTFHVTCLKTWLARRNVCPLCQAPDVATPRYQPGYHHGGEADHEESHTNEEDDSHGERSEEHGSSTIEMPRRSSASTEQSVETRAASRAFGGAFQLHQRR